MGREKESDSKDNSKEKPGALILAELGPKFSFSTNLMIFLSNKFWILSENYLWQRKML